MQAKSILTAAALVLAALFILDVPAAMATHTWEGDVDVNWSTPGNWDQGTVPDTADDVIIPSGAIPREPTFNAVDTVASVTIQSGRTVTVNAAMTVNGAITVNSDGTMAMSANVETDTLTIECDAVVTTGACTLTITDSGGLTIDAATFGCTNDGLLNVDGAGEVKLTGGGTHTINATAADYGLRLSVWGSTLRIEDNDVTLTGSGYVEGRNDGAQILITDGETLTSYITIEGALLIDDAPLASATFLNHGLVHANRTSDYYVLDVKTAAIDDSSGDRWQASGGTLDFTAAIGTLGPLAGDLVISSGEIVVHKALITTGALEMTGGTLTMNADVTVSSATISGTVTTGANTLTITGASGLTINADGLLNVDGAGLVDLTGGGDSQTVDGELRLSVSGSKLQISTNDVTLIGSGYVEGRNDGAQILITDGETLTSQITIRGCMLIDDAPAASATFINGSGGLVHANDDSGCTLEIATNSLGVSAGNWQVSTHSSNFLKLNHGSSAGTHSGNFTVSNGTLDIYVNVTTSGNLSFTGGTIDVSAGNTFQAG